MVIVNDQLILTVVCATFIFVIVYGHAYDLSTSDAILGFFLQPRAFLAYAIILAAPVFFFKWLPGSVVMFALGIIWLLSKVNGF